MNIKTAKGFESFGKFFIGNNRELAADLFRKLKGSKNANEKNFLLLDLMETANDLPVNIQMISCSLDELGENCKIITKEVFKIFNLKEK